MPLQITPAALIAGEDLDTKLNMVLDNQQDDVGYLQSHVDALGIAIDIQDEWDIARRLAAIDRFTQKIREQQRQLRHLKERKSPP